MSTSVLYRGVLCVLWGRWVDRIQVLSTVKLPSCTYLTPVTVSYRSSCLPVVGGGRDNFSQIASYLNSLFLMMATANSYLASYLKQPYIGVSDELSHGVVSIVEVTISNSVEVAIVPG